MINIPVEGITVKRIGAAYFISMPSGNGAKRLYLTREQMDEIWNKVGATLSNPARYQVNGETVALHTAKRLP